jgi:hypothetical protein
MKPTSWILGSMTAVMLAACGGGAGTDRNTTGGTGTESGATGEGTFGDTTATMSDTTSMSPGATPTDTATVP